MKLWKPTDAPCPFGEKHYGKDDLKEQGSVFSVGKTQCSRKPVDLLCSLGFIIASASEEIRYM